MGKKRKYKGSKKRTRSRSRDRSRSSSRSDSYCSDSEGGDDSNDDREGLVKWRQGDKIRNNRYKVEGIAGQGTFGTVLDVYDTKHREKVVLKVVRSVKRYLEAAYVEIDILEKLRKADPNKGSLVVRLYGSFTTYIGNKRHVCICFEKLGRSLYDFVKRNRYRGFRTKDLRCIGRQIIHSVRFCHATKLTHTDLKLENVLFVDHDYDLIDTSRFRDYRVPKDPRVRLIDFGGATFEDERHARIINTRQYRAPEVIFGLSWSYPSDMWSIGCILAELATGELLFSTHADAEHLKLMEVILDEKLPKEMVDKSLEPYRQIKRQNQARANGDATPAGGTATRPRLPEAPIDRIFDWESFEINWPRCAPNEDSERHVKRTQTLEALLETAGHPPELADLCRKCLRYRPDERISAKEAFDHPFFDGPTSGNVEYMKIEGAEIEVN